jgi:chloramphenicol 3-O-phosphotransferase
MTHESTAARRGAVLVLSGPPGAGKTTISRALADSAEQPTVHLATDLFYVAIRKGFVPPFLPQAARQNTVVLDVIAEAMLGYSNGGYDVIVDGIVGPWSLPQFVGAAARAGCALSFVVLRPSYEEALARAVAREGKELKASGPIRGLYGAFAALGTLERHAIDTSGDTIETTMLRVRDGVAAGTFRVAGESFT